jgi:hypothetical protein
MMEAVRTSETSVDNYFTRQHIPEDNSEQVVEKLLVGTDRQTGDFISLLSFFFLESRLKKKHGPDVHETYRVMTK